MDRSWRITSPSVLCASLVTLILVLGFVALAPSAPVAAVTGDGPTAPGDSSAGGGLSAIDVQLAYLPDLQRLGIVYQDEARGDVYRAAATAAQLEQLRQSGVPFSEIGQVAIFQQGGWARQRAGARSFLQQLQQRRLYHPLPRYRRLGV